jgi:hypothetical protein
LSRRSAGTAFIRGGERVAASIAKEEERVIVQEIVRDYASREQRVQAWIERTGKSERAFYRRLAEMR